ncbi:MAG: antibiotic biosynthesis monooxygenase [Clostridia bacterium]|nr:antibiotic biosynthesis monooxygenase [Clostridia bacterium]
MITINIRYCGENGASKRFVEEMISSGIVDEIRNEEGNIRYEYFMPLESSDYVLLIDSWQDQQALDKHHAMPVMQKIMELREKYDLHMEVEKYISIESEENDIKHIRK